MMYHTHRFVSPICVATASRGAWAEHKQKKLALRGMYTRLFKAVFHSAFFVARATFLNGNAPLSRNDHCDTNRRHKSVCVNVALGRTTIEVLQFRYDG